MEKKQTIIAEILKLPGGYQVTLDGITRWTTNRARTPYRGLIALANRTIPNFEHIKLTLTFEELNGKRNSGQ